jgi:predicted butyrate kinase (DUF1464 family)
MRVVGIDPGTTSFDLCGISDGDGVILDVTIPSSELNEDPDALFALLDSIAPLDLIVGHSGLGTALRRGRDIDEMAIAEMLLAPKRELESKNTPELIQAMYKLYRDPRIREYPFIFIPAAVHLPTIPEHRKANRIDMGTADKLCCAVLGVKEQAETLSIPYDKTSFVLIELGFGFNAALLIEGGKVVDGLGGTNLGPGFLAQGPVDAELARILYYVGERPSRLTFASGGVVSMSGKEGLTPWEFVNHRETYSMAWEGYIEGVVKAIGALAKNGTREVLVSGRLSGYDDIMEELGRRCSIRRLKGLKGVKTAKHAAQGAAILANGLAGGEYRELVDNMEIRGAKGTILDHIHFQGIGLDPKAMLGKIWRA